MIRSFETYEAFEEWSSAGSTTEEERTATTVVIAPASRAILPQPCRTFGTYSPEEFTKDIGEFAYQHGVSRSALVRELLATGLKAIQSNRKLAAKTFSRVKKAMTRPKAIAR